MSLNRTPEAIVLVTNERTVGNRFDFWEDETGKRYHYPNSYRNLVTPGIPFIYYRGVRRNEGGRGSAEYFGHGVIGETSLDPKVDNAVPKGKWRWYCEILGYEPFESPVPIRVNGAYYEKISNARSWGNGVRPIRLQTYTQIIRDAGASATNKIVIERQPLTLPPLETTSLQLSVLELVFRPSMVHDNKDATLKRTTRRSTRSNEWGRRGEEVVFDYLSNTLKGDCRTSLRWIASEGLTPGWDIEYEENGSRNRVEVKATTLPVMEAFELTPNELSAANSQEGRYLMALVTEVHTRQPKLAWMENLKELIANGIVSAEPTGWQIRARA